MRLIDIAKKANVSLGTVDRVVNNRGKVASETEKNIRKIIDEFGYTPNLRARSLSSKKKTNFAVLITKPQGEDYWAKILSGIRSSEKVIREFGVEITEYLFDQDDDLQFAEMAKQILKIHYDGVLLVPAFQKEARDFVTLLGKNNIPYVFIDLMIDDAAPLCSISQNNFQSGFLAARLLNYIIESGGEILLIKQLMLADNFDLVQERLKGFMSFFETEFVEKRIIHSLEIPNPKYEKLEAFLNEKLLQFPNIKGIFIANSKTHWIARYLRENGISTIKLVGFDLIEQNIRYLKDGIIEFILFDYAEKQGEMGLRILFDHVLKKMESEQRIIVPIHIVTKENLEGFLL